MKHLPLMLSSMYDSLQNMKDPFDGDSMINSDDSMKRSSNEHLVSSAVNLICPTLELTCQPCSHTCSVVETSRTS